MHLRLLAAVPVLLALPVTAAAQHADHANQHDDGEIHSHRGPGPHFIDAFFTENAFIERKVRPDVFAASGEEGDEVEGELEVEWALARNLSLIVKAPFRSISPEVGSAESGVGDMSIGTKWAVINHRRAFILALGADLMILTGDSDRGLGEEHSELTPFVLGWIPFGEDRRWGIQTAAHLSIPLASEEDPHAEVSAALSWTSPLGLTPIVELITEFSTGGGPAAWSLAPEFRWEFAPEWELGAAVRLPISDTREADYEIAFGLIRHFALPR